MKDLSIQISNAVDIRQTNPRNALKIFKDILNESESADDALNSVQARFNIAITYLILGNYSESLKTFTLCLQHLKNNDDKMLRCEVLRGIGSNHFRLYNYKEAIKYYYLSEQESIESHCTKNLHMIYQDFGALYNRLMMYGKALEYSLKSLELAKQSGQNEPLQQSLMSIGACHYQLGNHDEALKYLNQSLELSSNNFAEANALHFLSLTRLNNNDFTEASLIANRQLKICRENNYHDFTALALRLLGDIKYKEENFPAALELYREGVAVLNNVGEKQIRFSIMKRITDVYEVTGDKDKMSALYKQLYSEHSDHFERSIQLKIEQIDVEYETESIRKQVETEKENNLKLTRALDKVTGLNAELHEMHEEKDHLMGIVAHDLKNPIQSILSSSRLINTSKENTEFVDELTDNIKFQSKRMIDLINRLLKHSAIDNGKILLNITAFKAGDILHRLIEANRIPALNKNMHIITEGFSEESLICSDFELLYQILENLLSNAIKFSPMGKNIFIKCSLLVDSLSFEIQDEGPGFTAEDMEKMYSGYTKLSAKPTGNEDSTGLGLSIVKKLCNILEADIRLESAHGKGAKFIITLKQ